MIKQSIRIFWALVLVVSCFSSGAEAAEPSMADYTAFPIFLTQSVTPNILIMLDNSGSMNFNAYGTWPGDYGTVSDAPYGKVDVRVRQSRDDSEHQINTTANWYNHADLDLGAFSTGGVDPSIIGLRFQNVDIPQGAIITRAYIEFEANDADSEAASYTIWGEASDHAQQYSTTNSDIADRPNTVAQVAWNNVPAWFSGVDYQTEDISVIVQEIVQREGWQSGNAMAFKIAGTGKRDAKSYDTSSSNAPRLVVEYDPLASEHYYYGYFDPTATYSYGANIFYRDAAGPWSGNWLNWLCMRRIDVLRKVLMGGLATSRTGGGNTTLIGETPAQTNRVFKKYYDGREHNGDMTPYSDGVYRYQMEGGYIKVYDASGHYQGRYVIKVDKNEATEPRDFFEGNISGVLQRLGDKARWGNLWFKSGSGNGQSGGRIANRVGTNITTLITDLQNTSADTSTPLGEAYYVAMQYFKQEKPQSGLDYDNNAIGAINATNDPYYNGDEYVECAKSFVILLTDGASTRDSKVPSWLKDYDGDGDKTGCNEFTNNNCDYGDYGTDFLDDVALYARTTDLRGDLDGDQSLILYTIYAFGSDDNARVLLKDAARNGGFDDRNGNNRPDGTYTSLPEARKEWDKNGDGIPDTYYEAADGYKLEEELLAAITDILQRAGSGTSASVLSTTREGEGNMIQAYFRPSVTQGVEDVLWTGYLQALWLDASGNLREDTDGDHALNTEFDRIVRYYEDAGTGDTRIRRYDIDGSGFEELNLEDITPIWEAGRMLHQRDPDERQIFTYLDKNGNQAVDDGVYDHTDTSGEVVRFHPDAAAQIKPYLGVKDGALYSYLGASHDVRAETLIEYIRGKDFDGLRPRTLTLNGTAGVWKLGDIVNSTPVRIATPTEDFGVLYEDPTYDAYWHKYKNREVLVVAGGNDGMLHAFTSWTTTNSGTRYEKATDALGVPLPGELGDEVWAYIPQSLLPHLKWLSNPEYTHVYYVDAEPFVFDARIFPDDAVHPNGWGTVLITGLNMGGKYIWSQGEYDDGSGGTVSETREFHPVFVCLDVTEPRSPRLLWERTYDQMGMSTATPGVLKVGRQDHGDTEKWYAVIGSGYTSYEGESSQPARVFVADLATGVPYQDSGNDWRFTLSNSAFCNRPITLDAGMDFETDAAYVAENYLKGGKWASTLHRLSTWKDGKPSLNPSDWTMDELFDSPRPVTAPVSLATDNNGRVWVYFGTGRFIGTADKTSDDQQFLFGVKDALFNSDRANTHALLDVSSLLDVTDYQVMQNGMVYPGSGACISWEEFLDQIKKTQDTDTQWADGWYRLLSPSSPSERCISKPTVLYGTVVVPTYVPSGDICGGGGDSLLYALYYETGTAYYNAMINLDAETADTHCGSGTFQNAVSLSLGKGAPPENSGIHMTPERVKAFLQKSTGEVMEIDLDTAISPINRLTNWLTEEE